MRRATWMAAAVLVATVLFGALGEARHVTVSYIDADRPPEYAQEDVIAAIQRAMREWEAHNDHTALVFNWGGVITLSNAPSDFNNVVIRWLNTDYSSRRGFSCSDYSGCAIPLPVPTNHIFMSTWWDSPNTSPRTRRWNNPKWTRNMNNNEDMISVLTHEMAHLFENADDAPSAGLTVLRAPANYGSRYLWNWDILHMDYRYLGPTDRHYQALQWFAVDGSTGNVSLLRQTQPSYRVLSPASIATGNNIGDTGHYVVAYGTRTPAGSAGSRNALLVRLTDAVSFDTDRVVQNTVGGVDLATTFHRPCVAVAQTGTDYYMAWASPVEDANGWRQVLTAESHAASASTWSEFEAIPGALTRSGVTCSIDRATERLVVAYTGGGEEGIFLTHRPSLTAGAGQWAFPVRVGPQAPAVQWSTYGPPDLAFDFFSTAPGALTWQDNVDLGVYSAPVTFSGGTYVVGSAVLQPSVEPARLRSWPVASVEANDILGLSTWSAALTPNLPGEERRNFFLQLPNVYSSETYAVGGANAARHYTGAASNRVLLERAFLSTANLGQ